MAAKDRYGKSPKIKAKGESPKPDGAKDQGTATAEQAVTASTPGAKPEGDAMNGADGVPVTERHGRERTEMAERHGSELKDMHKRHQKEHAGMMGRQMDEAGMEMGGAAGGDGGASGEAEA